MWSVQNRSLIFMFCPLWSLLDEHVGETMGARVPSAMAPALGSLDLFGFVLSGAHVRFIDRLFMLREYVSGPASASLPEAERSQTLAFEIRGLSRSSLRLSWPSPGPGMGLGGSTR